jgi:hypothetical protein
MRKTWIYVSAHAADGVRYQSKHLSYEAAVLSIHDMLTKAERNGFEIKMFHCFYGLKSVDLTETVRAIKANRSGDPKPDPVTELERALKA